jgi:hypothetical protein
MFCVYPNFLVWPFYFIWFIMSWKLLIIHVFQYKYLHARGRLEGQFQHALCECHFTTVTMANVNEVYPLNMTDYCIIHIIYQYESLLIQGVVRAVFDVLWVPSEFSQWQIPTWCTLQIKQITVYNKYSSLLTRTVI